MRLIHKKIEELGSVFNFREACKRKRGTSCCHPEYPAYYQESLEAIRAQWESSRPTIYPPARIRCEECEYANQDLGVYDGKASDMGLSYSPGGTIPVPLKDRNKVWLHNVNQKKLDAAIKEISPDIEAFALSGSPGLSDLSFLEKFGKLKTVYLWWNNKTDKLWDFTKTPEIGFLRLADYNHLSDISQLGNARKLRYLDMYSENGILSSIKPLQNLANLEFLKLYIKVADKDILPIINLPAIKYFDCQIDIFDMESYAMFEVRRQDVMISFHEGMLKLWEDSEAEEDARNGNNTSNYYVWFAGKGQGRASYGENDKLKKYSDKYSLMKEKYSAENYFPVLKLTPHGSPVESWRQTLAEGIDLHTEEQISEIEKIINDYINRTAVCSSKGQAKNVLKDTIKKIMEFNERTQFIETEERQEIYDYLSSFFKEKWHDEFEELLCEADW